MMQTKPLAPAGPLAAAPQPARPAPPAGKPGEFSQLLKAAQADVPAATPTPGLG